jgi:DNA-binding NarL/FixJ family response regulator
MIDAPMQRSRQPGPAGRIRVVVADDHERLRVAVSGLLSALEDFEVVGVAADGAEAVALTAALGPDVVLMDVSMPGVDGIEATRRILAASPATRIVILTAVRERRDEALRAGAAAHLLKDAPPAELVRCLRLAAAGQDVAWRFRRRVG